MRRRYAVDPRQTRGHARRARKPAAEPRTGPWLWEVTKGEATSYVFALPPSGVMAEEVPEPVWNALARVSRLYLIGEPAPGQAAGLVSLPDEGKLDAFLEPAELAALDAELELTVREEMRLHLRPAIALAFLSRPLPPSDVAKRLRERHRDRGGKVVEVQVAERIFSAMVDDQRWAIRLRETLRNLEQVWEEAHLAIRLYRQGDAVPMKEEASRSYATDDMAALDHIEIEAWMSVLPAALEVGGLFAAIDLDEIVVDEGILDQLTRRGFAVRRLGLGTPPVVRENVIEWPARQACVDAVEQLVAKVSEANPARDPAVLHEKLFNPALLRFCRSQPLSVLACMNQAADLERWFRCATPADEGAQD